MSKIEKIGKVEKIIESVAVCLFRNDLRYHDNEVVYSFVLKFIAIK